MKAGSATNVNGGVIPEHEIGDGATWIAVLAAMNAINDSHVFLTTLVRRMRLDPEGTRRIDRGGTVST